MLLQLRQVLGRLNLRSCNAEPETKQQPPHGLCTRPCGGCFLCCLPRCCSGEAACIARLSVAAEGLVLQPSFGVNLTDGEFLFGLEGIFGATVGPVGRQRHVGALHAAFFVEVDA